MRDLRDENLRIFVRSRIWDVMEHSHPLYLREAHNILEHGVGWTLEETEDVRKTLVWMKKHTVDFPFVPRHWAGTYVGEQMRGDVL